MFITLVTTAPFTDTVDAVKAESLLVFVENHNGDPVPGVVVTLASTGGLVSSTSLTTDASGLRRARFTYGTAAGNQTATATVTGLVGSPQTITFNATAGNAVSIAKTAGDNVTASPSTQVTHTVQSRDRHGNAKAGVTIDWTLGTGGGSITPAQNVTAGVSATASATRTLGGGSGSQTATATAAALSGATVTYSTTAVWTVNVSDNTFAPTNRAITMGDSVTWAWQGTTSLHNVTFASAVGAPATIPDRSSGTAKRTFAVAGTFNYSCTNHGGMNGTVTVTP
jgi:plastocyanin